MDSETKLQIQIDNIFVVLRAMQEEIRELKKKQDFFSNTIVPKVYEQECYIQ